MNGRWIGVGAVAVGAILASSSSPLAQDANVTRATLDNGLRVVIVRDPLAPVVTLQDNYLVGGQETPDGFPGTAHAQEHMSFRGCAGVSADQTSAIFAQLGGYGDAETQQTVTQYFSTVPAADLDIALRVDAACMQDVDDAESEWAQERGAIEQEVARDLSNPTYKFLTRLNEDMFSGTPYAHDALGTKASFDATTAAMLKTFYDTWYAPNNSILVVTGDVDPAATLAMVREFYGKIPRKPLPARAAIDFQPVKSETFSLESNLPYVLALIAYRMPGTDSPDFAAGEVLSDVLDSQRGDLYGLVPAGKALGTEFELFETFPKASVGLAVAAVPAGTDPSGIVTSMRGIIAKYLEDGLPADLVEAAKRSETVQAGFARNSVSGLASVWSQAVAVEHRNSPDDDVAAIRRVTVDDVNRVARQLLVDSNSITGTLVPSASGAAVAAKGFGGGEQTTSAPTKPVTLPAWAASKLEALHVPALKATWTDTTLPNKIRLIVKTERASPTITVVGSVHTDPRLQEPATKEGVSDVLEELFSYGTTSLDRIAFQKALDDIGASESAGSDFSLRVLKPDFARGMALLADNELHPALPADAFATVKQEIAQFADGNLKSPGYKAEHALAEGLLPARDPALRETTPETVAAVSLDDVKQYYQAAFRPDVTTIVVIGDVTPAEARATVAKAFGAWAASGQTPDLVLPKVPLNAPSTVAVPDATQVQASVDLAEEVGLTRFDPDYYALQLGDHVLGGGFYATRLYHDLRQVAGYVYAVDNTLAASKSRAVYTVSYGCDPANVTKARDLIARDLRAMQDENVTAQELQQAKALLLRQIPLAESSEDAIARGFVARANLGLPLNEPARAAARYYALSADDIRAAFKKWIRPDGFVQVVRGPEGK